MSQKLCLDNRHNSSTSSKSRLCSLHSSCIVLRFWCMFDWWAGIPYWLVHGYIAKFTAAQPNFLSFQLPDFCENFGFLYKLCWDIPVCSWVSDSPSFSLLDKSISRWFLFSKTCSWSNICKIYSRNTNAELNVANIKHKSDAKYI